MPANTKFIVWAMVFSLVTPFMRNAAASQTLPGHVPPAVSRLNAIGRLPATNRLRLVIGLPLRNGQQLTNFLQRLYDPATPDYHRYLTPDQFTEQFGPSQQDYQALITFASAHGLSVAHTHPGRTLLDVEAPVSTIEKVFHLTMRQYRHPSENRTFFAPDSDPTLDVNIPVSHITGLDNYLMPHPNARPIPLVASANPKPNGGSGPNGMFRGYDFRNAYAPGVPLTGSGQAVGLLELGGYNSSDVTNYENATGMSNVPVQNILLDGASGSAGSDDSEPCLDIEMAVSMAPGLSNIIVYEAPMDATGWLDAVSEMADPTHGEARPLQLSSSWTVGDNSSADDLYMKFAAQGQSCFQASGDDGAYYWGSADTFPIPQWADSPYLTIVGGTELTTDSSGARQSETTWNVGFDSNTQQNSASGGGISQNYDIPVWQEGIDMTASGGSKTKRNVPDVAMVAYNVEIACNGSWSAFQGTSVATPLWAGFMALVNQQSATAGIAPGGLINSAIYTLGKKTNAVPVFNDIADGSDNASLYSNYFAVAGYDLCTGWGSPAGSNFVNALSPPPEGALEVTITPAIAVSSGAQWQVDDGITRKSGAIATSLSAGNNDETHIVSFTAVPGWVTPASQTVTVKKNTTTEVSAVYVEYIPRAVLTVITNGRGSITPVENGKSLAIGTNYTLVATPAANFLFSNWVGGTSQPYHVLSTNASYTCNMQSNLVVIANFVTNEFLAAQGSYYGLFSDTNSPRQQNSSGGFNFHVYSSRLFTGTLSLGSNTASLFGTFNVAGQAQVVTKLNAAVSVTTALQLDFSGQTVSGTVSNNNFAATLNGFRNGFSAANPATAFAGQYTMAILGTNDPDIGPYGISYGAVTVGTLGTVTFAGALADGTLGLTESSAISPGGYWPLYLKLDGGAGSLWAWTCISNRQIAASASWINATNSSALAVYRSGFTNQNATIIGSWYNRTNKPLFGFTNAQVVIEQAGTAPFAFTNQATISATGIVTVTNAEDTNKLSLRINSVTGVISGSFANPLNVKQIIPLNGVLLQGDASAAGYFLGTNQSGLFMMTAP